MPAHLIAINKKYSVSIFFLSVFLLLIGCSKKKNADDDFVLKYDLKHPDKEMKLKHQLTEVSGLSFVSDSVVALIEDENGYIFNYNLNSEEIVNKISFGKDGDYEDVEVLNDIAYVLRSDGRLYQVTHLYDTISGVSVEKFNTGLGKKNDTEGLCYDFKRNVFLIACKGSPGDDKSFANKKAIYSLNRETKVIDPTPFALIDLEEVEKKSGISKVDQLYEQTVALADKSTDAGFFQPSALSVHPITDDIYVLSAVNNLLVILDHNGTLRKVVKLEGSVFKQPEGIAFDNQGNLYISNEGKKGKGDILKFAYRDEKK